MMPFFENIYSAIFKSPTSFLEYYCYFLTLLTKIAIVVYEYPWENELDFSWVPIFFIADVVILFFEYFCIYLIKRCFHTNLEKKKLYITIFSGIFIALLIILNAFYLASLYRVGTVNTSS